MVSQQQHALKNNLFYSVVVHFWRFSSFRTSEFMQPQLQTRCSQQFSYLHRYVNCNVQVLLFYIVLHYDGINFQKHTQQTRYFLDPPTLVDQIYFQTPPLVVTQIFFPPFFIKQTPYDNVREDMSFQLFDDFLI